MASPEQQAVPSTWNRNVDYNAGTDFLDVSVTGNNPPPPAAPAGQTRNDTADEITVFSVDRGGGGARILYHAPGNEVELTGIEMKNGDPIPDHLEVFVNPPGTLLRLTVTKDDDDTSDEVWDYYVQGTVDGEAKQTEDPRIRNRGQ